MEWAIVVTLLLLLTETTYGDGVSRDCCRQCRALPGLRGPTTPDEAQTYLIQFGYLSVVDFFLPNADHLLRDAVTNFQAVAHINETGILDDDTYRMLQINRCGNVDVTFYIQPRRRKRSFFSGLKWTKNHLTYRILNYSPDLTREEIDTTIATAFKMWEDVTPLTFTPSTCSPVDIELSFVSGDDVLHLPFKRTDVTYGYAFYPNRGNIFFNEDVIWTLDLEPGTDEMNFLYTAVHEIGHSIGLEHSANLSSIMYPFGNPGGDAVKLGNVDIRVVQDAYGTPEDANPIELFPNTDCSTTHATSVRTFPSTTTPMRPMLDPRETVTQALTTDMITSARPISSLTSTLTTQTTRIKTPRPTRTRRTTNFLATTTAVRQKSTKAMQLTTTASRTTNPGINTPAVRQRRTTNPRPTTRRYDFTSVQKPKPSPVYCHRRIDAITQGLDGEIYAFRGTKVLKLNDFGVDSGYPKSIGTVFPGGPQRVDGAMTLFFDRAWTYKRYLYLITEKKVWRYWFVDNGLGYILDRAFPKSFHKYFNICDDRSKIDAIYSGQITKTGDTSVYFFSGDKYAEVLINSGGTIKSPGCFVWTQRTFASLPVRIDAAFRHDSNGKGYFFSGECYYRLSPNKDVLGPRDTGYWWLGCPRSQNACRNRTKHKHKQSASKTW